MRKIISKLLRAEDDHWPPEISDYEKKAIEGIITSELSMAGKSRLIALAMAVRYVVRNKVPGDFVECGVWRGGASILAQNLFQHYGDSSRRFYMFDTFTGMTEPSEIDTETSSGILAKDLKPKVQPGALGWCECSVEEVKQNILNHGGNIDCYEIIEGDVCETLKQKHPKKISILRLDTDWYESTKIEMEILYPKLVGGGVLHIDDYGHWSGSREAVDEYFEKQTQYKTPLFSIIDKSCRVAVREEA